MWVLLIEGNIMNAEQIAIKNCNSIIDNLAFMMEKFQKNESIPGFVDSKLYHLSELKTFHVDDEQDVLFRNYYGQSNLPRITSYVGSESDKVLSSGRFGYIGNVRGLKINKILFNKQPNSFQIDVTEPSNKFTVAVRRDSTYDVNPEYGPFSVQDISDEAELFQLSMISNFPQYVFDLANKMTELLKCAKNSDRMRLEYNGVIKDLEYVNLSELNK